MERLLRMAVDPANGALVFATAICLYYGIWPSYLEHRSLVETREIAATLPWIAAAWILLGAAPFKRKAVGEIDHARARVGVYAAFLAFGFFALVTIVSASSIPIMEAMRGASAEEIALSREEFLKARFGWASALPYLNAMLTGSLLPYALALALLHRYRGAALVLVVFFAYSMIFMEKAFFLRIVLPMMALIVVSGSRSIRLSWIVAAAFALLMANIAMSGFSSSGGLLGFLFFRALEVPPITVLDSLDYWLQRYRGDYFSGSTSTFLSTFLGMDRIPFEREVFEYQFGAFETGTASSNSAFFVEAYVNFGYAGVIALSAGLGALIGHIGRSSDQALRCLTPLILYTVFVGGLLGLLISNGLMITLMASAWVLGRTRAEPDTSESRSDADKRTTTSTTGTQS